MFRPAPALFLLLILATAAFAAEAIPEGGEPILPDDIFGAITYRGPMREIGAKAFVLVDGREYPRAVRLQSPAPQKNFWDSNITLRIAKDVAQDDILLASFDARLVSPVPKGQEARIMAFFQAPNLGGRKPLRKWVAVSPQWETYHLAFRAKDPYTAGKATLSFGLQAGPMAVEIADISLKNYAKTAQLSDFPSIESKPPVDPFLQPWLQMTAEWRQKTHEKYPDLEKTALDTLRPGHPRLMMTEEREKWLKDRISKDEDEDLARLYEFHLKQADKELEDQPFGALRNDRRNPGLWNARRAMRHVYSLGTAWRLSGERKYFDRLRTDLLQVCSETWQGPRLSFLNVSEMTHAVAVGYDWLYHDLSEADRKTIRNALIAKGVDQGVGAYKGDEWFPGADHNWNPVCNFSMIIGALAVADEVPDKARYIIAKAVDSLPLAMVRFAPDGAWTEGPGYWGYTTTYTVFGLTALETALGRDFGLSDIPGFSLTGEFRIHGAGPTNLTLNFADAGKSSRRRASWPLFWLARRYDRPLYAQFEHRQIREFSPKQQHLAWYEPRPEGEMPALDLDRKFDGPVGVAVMRSKWFDPDALFVGVKAGYAQVNHGHLDMGNFEMDALNIRWSRDLGAENYSLPGYFHRRDKRWQYYRCQSRSHSVPLIDGEDQYTRGTSKIVAYDSLGDGGAYAVVDLSKSYPKRAKEMLRGVRMMPGRRSILVQDEFQLDAPHRLTWAMTTEAQIATNGAVATLTQKGKQLRATIVSPEGAQFTQESAEQKKPLQSNKGFRRLLVDTPAPAGRTTIAIHLAPVWESGAEKAPNASEPIATWQSGN